MEIIIISTVSIKVQDAAMWTEVFRNRNKGRFFVKIDSNYHLASSVGVEMLERSQLKIKYVVKLLFYLTS